MRFYLTSNYVRPTASLFEPWETGCSSLKSLNAYYVVMLTSNRTAGWRTCAAQRALQRPYPENNGSLHMSYQANHVQRYRCLYVISSSSALTRCKNIRCRTLYIERRFGRSLLISAAIRHSSLLYSVYRFPYLPSSRSCVIFHPLSNTSPTLWRKRPWIHHMAAFISDCKGRSFWVHEHKRRG